MSVQIKVANSQCKIFGELPPFVVDTLYDRLAFMRKGDEWSPTVAEGKWDGVRRLFRKWDGVFPTGLLRMVRTIFDECGVDYELEDIRSKPLSNRHWHLDLPFDLRYYQRETVDACKTLGRGICSLPTASGKTVTFSVLIGELGITPTVVYVPSLLLLQQTAEAIQNYVRGLDDKPVEVGVVGDGVCDIREITVMTVQTAITAYNMAYDPDKGTVRKLTKAEIARANAEPYKAKRRNTEDPDRSEDLGFVRTKQDEIRTLIEGARVVICDECFAGRTRVLMPDGTTKTISSLVNSGYSGDVMSWNIETQMMEPKRVIGHIRKPPLHDVVRIGLGSSGTITCTSNHLIMTPDGWKPAGEIERGEMLLSPPGFKDNRACNGLSSEAMEVAIGSSLGDGNIAPGHRTCLSWRYRATHADKDVSYLRYKMRYFESIGYWIKDDVLSGYTGAKEWRGVTRSSPELARIRRLSRIERIGLLTPRGLSFFYCDDGSLGTVCHRPRLNIYSMNKGEVDALCSKLREFGLHPLPNETAKGWVLDISKDTTPRFFELVAPFVPMCMSRKVPPEYRDTIETMTPRDVEDSPLRWIPVRGVSPASESESRQDVYCLEVEDNNNFIANGCVVHNCHRAASFIWQEVLKKSKAAYYRFAFSATPWREDNTGMLITASFGRVIYEKTHSELIREGFLSRPYVFVAEVPSSMIPPIPMDTYQEVVKHCIVRCEPRNRMISELATTLSPIGPTLLLVQEIPHGKSLEELIPGSRFICAKTPKTKKKEAIKDLLSGELPVLIATPIGDEGLDLVELKVLILCHAGKSAGKLKQRVGRTSRIHEGKDYSIVVDLRDQGEYLSNHSRRRVRVFLQEEEWVVIQATSDGWTSLQS